MSKVTKKDERLARTLFEIELVANGFPENDIADQVDMYWPELLEPARLINFGLRTIFSPLDGETETAEERKA